MLETHMFSQFNAVNKANGINLCGEQLTKWRLSDCTAIYSSQNLRYKMQTEFKKAYISMFPIRAFCFMQKFSSEMEFNRQSAVR